MRVSWHRVGALHYVTLPPNDVSSALTDGLDATVVVEWVAVDAEPLPGGHALAAEGACRGGHDVLNQAHGRPLLGMVA